MKKLRLNSSIDPKIQQKINDARKKREYVDDMFAKLRENFDLVMEELDDFESGKLDVSSRGYISDCLSVFNRAVRDVADAAETFAENFNNLE